MICLGSSAKIVIVSLAFIANPRESFTNSKRGNSVAVADDVFLKAYFTIVIKNPEFQTEVRRFLNNPLKTYTQTLEPIHVDNRSQTTGNYMRGVPCSILALAITQRGKTEDHGYEVSTEGIFKDWYLIFSNLVSDQTPDNNGFVQNFKFYFERRCSDRVRIRYKRRYFNPNNAR